MIRRLDLIDINRRPSKTVKVCLFIVMMLTIALQSFSTTADAGCNTDTARSPLCSAASDQGQSILNSDVNAPWQTCIDAFGCSHFCQCHFANTEMPTTSSPSNVIGYQVMFASKPIYQSPYRSSVYRPPII